MDRTLKGRFEKYILYAIDGCWYWLGAVSNQGRGRINVNYRNCIAARVSFELFKGPIPDGVLVCHTCDNGLCVNPDHLFLGSTYDNAIDMLRKGRCAGAKLTERNVIEIRQSNLSFREVADKYSLTEDHARKIIRGDRWKYLNPSI